MIDTISTGKTNQSARRESRTFWFGFLFFVSVVGVTVVLTIARTNGRAAVEVCELIRDNYFRAGEPEVRSFIERCLVEASTEPLTFSKRDEIKRINRRLTGLKTSHLSVFSPVENKQLWTNTGLDTGIRARRIDGEIVVYRLLPSSPAQRAGVKVGDAITMVNGEAIDDYDVESTPGKFRLARGPKLFDLEIGVEDLADHRGPTLDTRSDGIGVLKIGSFLAQYFDDDRWTSIASRIPGHRGIVVDVRGNSGGSFPASLRALSPFFCRPTLIGDLWTTAEAVGAEGPVDLPDDLQATVQMRALMAGGVLNLKTYSTYGCYEGPVTVLVDQSTSSVAEIFSEGMKLRKNSRVWGVPTAGQVVMAKWFEIGGLGGGDYSISIPVAGYETREKKVLENDGVDPQKILVYDLEKALQGRDNWMEEAIRSVSF